MLQFIFDLDDTLLFHQNDLNYNYICENKELSYYLDNLQHPKYILTNGTSDHANLLVTKMNINDKFHKIYARDTIPYNKPNPSCYQYVKQDILQINQTNIVILFFDDLLVNLQEAHKQNWITIWIHPSYNTSSKYEFVDYAFPNIITALIYFSKKTPKY